MHALVAGSPAARGDTGPAIRRERRDDMKERIPLVDANDDRVDQETRATCKGGARSALTSTSSARWPTTRGSPLPLRPQPVD
jgi:hypothetical protein